MIRSCHSWAAGMLSLHKLLRQTPASVSDANIFTLERGQAGQAASDSAPFQFQGCHTASPSLEKC